MTMKKYDVKEKIRYAKLTQSGVKDGISMKQLSKMFKVADNTLGKWLKAYENHEFEEKMPAEKVSDLGMKLDVMNENFRNAFKKLDSFYDLIESKAEQFIEALTFLGNKLNEPDQIEASPDPELVPGSDATDTESTQEKELKKENDQGFEEDKETEPDDQSQSEKTVLNFLDQQKNET